MLLKITGFAPAFFLPVSCAFTAWIWSCTFRGVPEAASNIAKPPARAIATDTFAQVIACVTELNYIKISRLAFNQFGKLGCSPK